MAALALVTATQVKNRLATMQGVVLPTTLTDAIIVEYIEGATAKVLRAMKVTALPAADGLEREEAEDVCLDFVLFKIRRDFFGLNGETAEALNKANLQALAALEAAAAGDSAEAPEGVVARVVGGRNQ